MKERRIAKALRETAEALGWSDTQVAAAAGKTERAAQKWISGETEPGGETLVVLCEKMPGLHDRLFVGLAA